MTEGDLCLDPWHTDPDAPHATYALLPFGSVAVEGRGCLTCGIETVTWYSVAEEDMVDRVCECGVAYQAMPDGKGGLCLGEDVCSACLEVRIERNLAQ